MEPEKLICEHIQELDPYLPPDLEGLAARAGIGINQLVRLDANENPYGPSRRVREALGQFEGYSFYPNYRRLEAALARYADVAPANIVLGNGSDEIIDLMVRLFVAPGEGTIVCPPAFGMYAISTLGHRGQVLAVPRSNDFALNIEGIEELATADGTPIRPKLLFVTSPGNPDGQAVSLETIHRLLRLPLAVAVDEAYVEFGGQTAVPLLAEYPNLIVLRTLSKWAGLAGLRLGYAITSVKIADALARLRPPYNVNAAAVLAALATFEDLDAVRATIACIVAERERLYNALVRLPGAHPLPSQANFVLCRFGEGGAAGGAGGLAERLAEKGILLRSFSDPALADALRISVGRPEQNDAVVAALRAALSGAVNPAWQSIPVCAETASPYSAPTCQSQERAGNEPIVRRATSHRQTRETCVSVEIDLDGRGRFRADTGLGFLDHMLAQLAGHGLFDLSIQAQGDLAIDEHHTVEDVAIVLGQALDAALGDRQGIVRMGSAYAPLDEALAHVVVDLSGRPYAIIEAEFSTPRLGAVSTDLLRHFLETVAVHARMCLHARVLYGRNDHHRAEALFKALGRALDAATRLDLRREGIPSTKGVL
jgi:histidinol-phosphate aminotransferase